MSCHVLTSVYIFRYIHVDLFLAHQMRLIVYGLTAVQWIGQEGLQLFAI